MRYRFQRCDLLHNHQQWEILVELLDSKGSGEDDVCWLPLWLAGTKVDSYLNQVSQTKWKNITGDFIRGDTVVERDEGYNLSG